MNIDALSERLQELGFGPDQQGYRSPGWWLGHRRGWWELSRPWPAGADDLAPTHPGLWKRVDGAAAARHVFQWPDLVCPEIHEEQETGGLEELIRWAWSTAEGQSPPPGQGPTPADVQSWLPPEAYTVGAGRLLRQVELLCGENRLALITPVVDGWPADLPEPRRAWLSRLARQVQGQWPMVRLHLDEPTGPLTALVDLTGAPGWVAPALLSAGLACLRGAVTGLAEGAELLADATVVSEALALCLEQHS